MTKSEKIKLGVAGLIGALAVGIMVWYLFLSTPVSSPPPELPEGAPKPGARTPGGAR